MGFGGAVRGDGYSALLADAAEVDAAGMKAAAYVDGKKQRVVQSGIGGGQRWPDVALVPGGIAGRRGK